MGPPWAKIDAMKNELKKVEPVVKGQRGAQWGNSKRVVIVLFLFLVVIHTHSLERSDAPLSKCVSALILGRLGQL